MQKLNTMLGRTLISYAILGSACEQSETPEQPPLADGELPADTTFRDGSTIGQTIVQQKINANTSLFPIRLTRPRRTATDVADRAMVLASLLGGSQPPRSEVDSWATESIATRFEKSMRSFGAASALTISYFPHTDMLVAAREDAMGANGPGLLRDDAKETSLEILRDLEAAGLVSGSYVLARSGAVGYSKRGHAPYVRGYLFSYFKVLHGVILNDSRVEIAIGSGLQPFRIGVSAVQHASAGAAVAAPRSSTTVADSLTRRLEDNLQAISPSLTLQITAAPVPTYVLSPLADTAVVYPEVMLRWTSSSDQGVAKARVTTMSFFTQTPPRDIAPPSRPVMCREFDPGTRLAPRTSTHYVIDRDYLFSFLDPRDPMSQCSLGNMFLDNGVGAFRGILQSDLLYTFGFRSGDRALEVCSRDPNSEWFGACFELSDGPSFTEAFFALQDDTKFTIEFDRPGAGHLIRTIDIEDCPLVNGAVNCR